MANLLTSKTNCIKKMSQTSVNGNGAISSDKTSHFEYAKVSSSKKSHVEKSIERLYGPGALGIGFQTRRSLLEQQRQSPSKEVSSLSTESPKSMPRVFKHLRPEFRSQLFGNHSFLSSNGDSKSDSQSSSKENISLQPVCCKEVEGPIVRHIPIRLEDGHPCIKKSEINGIENSINNSFKKLEANGKTPKVSHTIEAPITKVANNLGDNYNLRSRSMTSKNVNLTSNSNILTPKTLNVTQSGKENIGITKKLINEIPVKVEKKESDTGGKHFLKIAEVEVNYLTKYADLIDKDINEFGHLIDEELKGKLLATVGKIRLLVTQKIKQFKGLCNKNINGSPVEDFPTTDDDLAGFWDMVSLQIDSVKSLISEWTVVKENGWKEVIPLCTKEAPKAKPIQKITVTAEQKAQIEVRRKAQEERRKAMREAIMAKRKQAKENGHVDKFASQATT